MQVILNIKDELIREFMKQSDMSLEHFVTACLTQYKRPEAVEIETKRVDSDDSFMVNQVLDRITRLKRGTVFVIRDLLNDDEWVALPSARTFGRQVSTALKERTGLVDIITGPPMKYRRL